MLFYALSMALGLTVIALALYVWLLYQQCRDVGEPAAALRPRGTTALLLTAGTIALGVASIALESLSLAGNDIARAYAPLIRLLMLGSLVLTMGNNAAQLRHKLGELQGSRSD